MNRSAIIVVAVLYHLVALHAVNVLAGDWPQWRGPNRDANSAEKGLLRQWEGDGPKSVWHASGLGDAYASVVVCDGLVFTIGRRVEDVFCFALSERTGAQRWVRKIGSTKRRPKTGVATGCGTTGSGSVTTGCVIAGITGAAGIAGAAGKGVTGRLPPNPSNCCC